MHSAVDELMWRQLLAPLQRGGLPLQVQLRTLLVTAILDGRLRPAQCLPSGRELARLAGLARNTVVLAYERLVDDGYLESRPRDGFYVQNVQRDELAAMLRTPSRLSLPDWSVHLGDEASNLRWLNRPSGWLAKPYHFVYGQFDADLFPLHAWRECSRQALHVAKVHKWAQDGTSMDSPELIDQLIQRVLPRRGIAATPEQILLTLGTQHGLYMLAELFGRAGAALGVEDPGYMDVRNIFTCRGVHVLPLPLDADGLVIADPLPACTCIYCTPSHQCPTGVTMAQTRRLELLEHAARHDQIILEDDYEPETQYAGKSLPALKALDSCGRVIYLSSFSKLLSPGLRLGYIVAPENVIIRLRQLRRLMIRQAPGNNQQAAALFIEQGHYDRLLQRTREELGARASILVEALRRHLPAAGFVDPHGGSSLWLRLPAGVDAQVLQKEALQRGVVFDPAEPFFASPGRARCIRLGYSSIQQDLIEEGIRLLAEAVSAAGGRG